MQCDCSIFHRLMDAINAYRPEAKTCWTTGGEFIYDLLAGRYMGFGMKSGRPANYETELERLTPDYYTPGNVRRLGR